MSDQPAINDERLRAIEQRANGGEYHCREHFAQFDADDDVLFLLAIIARFRSESAQLAATHAAIRALPRYQSVCNNNRGLPTSELEPWTGALMDNEPVVKWSALARLLGDPAQEQP